MSKRLLFLTFLCAFILSSAAFGQVLSGIKGVVKLPDGQPASDATVQLKNTKRTKNTLTNEQGEFVFQKIQPGHYQLVITLIGYTETTQELDVQKDEITKLNIDLVRADGKLDDITVNGRNKYKADNVSGSLRLQTPILEVPQNIQVVGAQLIADQQVFDVVDGITRNVSGATRQGHWDNQYANIRMRGSKLPAFRNGMNIEASWGPTAEDMAMVERIEFVKGPAGFMLAAGEPGGFYNVVTKKPTGNTKGSVNMSLGSFSTYRAALDLDGKLRKDGKLLFRFNMAGQLKDSHVKYNFSNRYLIAPVLKYVIDESTSVTLEYTYQGSSYGTNGTYGFSKNAVGDLPNDFAYGDPALNPGKLRDHSAYVYFDHRLNKKWDMHAQLAYFNFSMLGNTIYPTRVYANGNMARSFSIGDEAGENRFAQVSFKGEERTGAIRHRLLFGVDAGNKKFWGDFRQFTDSIRLGTTFNIYNPSYGIPFANIPLIDRSLGVKTRAANSAYITATNYTSVYAQDELAFLNDKLRVSVAGRFTYAETVARTEAADIVNNVWSPRLGISYSITEETAVYGLYDQSFVPVSGIGPDEKPYVPIRGNDIEFGIKRDWFGGRLRTSVSAYQIKRKNALSGSDIPNPAGGFFQVQVGETTTKGIEFDANGEILPGLNANINYAYTDPKVTKEGKLTGNATTTIGNITTNSARHITNAWLQYRISKGFFQGFGAMFGMQWQAERTSANATKEPNAPAYFRTDAGLSYSKGRYGINLLVNNLGDDRKLYTYLSYATSAAATSFNTWIAEPRRNFRMTVSYRF
jgi:iron complex outermembrane recepter protein